jgi:excisionase family DNA binding protein
MLYTIEAAATATGLNKKTVLRAIKSGKITGTKDERGEWLIEPAELHLVFPPIADQNADGGVAPSYAEADVEELGAQIEALLRQAGARLRQQLDDVRRHRDDMAFSDEAEG